MTIENVSKVSLMINEKKHILVDVALLIALKSSPNIPRKTIFRAREDSECPSVVTSLSAQDVDKTYLD